MDTYHIHTISRGVCLREGSILLAWHKKHQYYFLPGGHVEPGEAAAAALERECIEEMGTAVSCGDFILLFEHAWPNGETVQHELTTLFRMAWNAEDTSLVSCVDHLEFQWVPVEELASVRFLPEALHASILALARNEAVPSFITTMR